MMTACACSGGGAQDVNRDRPTANVPTVSANASAATPEKPKDPPPALIDKPDVPQAEADYISFEGGLKVFPRQRRAEMQAVLLGSQTRALEFLVVAPGGATHESLLATGVKGEYLKRALEMIGLKEAEVKRGGRGYLDPPLGDKVTIKVRFIHAATKERTEVPVEDWLWDAQADANPEKGGWVFTGSYEQYDPRLNRSLIESDMKGNLVAVWRDASCVIDNARKNGSLPDVYSPNPKAPGIPDAQTEVVLVFEPYKEKG
jgi:hypothetical protein